MYQCGQCGKGFKVHINNMGLCIDCYERLKILQNQELLTAMMQANMAAEEMDTIAPWGPSTPRYNINAFAETIRRQSIMNNIRIENSSIGVINTGNIESLNQNIQFLGALNKDLAYELSNLSKAILQSSMAEEGKSEAIDNISYVADQYAKPEDKRNKSVLKNTISTITALVSTSADLVQLWESIKEMLI
ncbi:MAG TPA: hypothetical protein V6D26_23550 [Stenomitos sp.]